jgi:hypothetical protein
MNCLTRHFSGKGPLHCLQYFIPAHNKRGVNLQAWGLWDLASSRSTLRVSPGQHCPKGFHSASSFMYQRPCLSHWVFSLATGLGLLTLQKTALGIFFHKSSTGHGRLPQSPFYLSSSGQQLPLPKASTSELSDLEVIAAAWNALRHHGNHWLWS